VDKAAACLYVPEESIAAYRSAYWWGDFECIRPTVSIALSDRITPQVRPTEEAVVVAPVTAQTNEFTVGPNIIRRGAIYRAHISSPATVTIYRQGQWFGDGELTIYDAVGNVVNKIVISDNFTGGSRRVVGSWDLTDLNGRLVSAGTYLLRGAVVVDGRCERVSLMVVVR
jgi:hypothetical protein